MRVSGENTSGEISLYKRQNDHRTAHLDQQQFTMHQPSSEADTVILISDDESSNIMPTLVNNTSEMPTTNSSNQEPMFLTEDDAYYESVRYMRDAETQTEGFVDMEISDLEIQQILDIVGITWEDFSTLDNFNVISVPYY